MTGNRFEGSDRPGDFTGNQARKLHRQHEERLARQRQREQQLAEEEYLSRPLHGQEQVVNYMAGGQCNTPPTPKLRFADVEDADWRDDLDGTDE